MRHPSLAALLLLMNLLMYRQLPAGAVEQIPASGELEQSFTDHRAAVYEVTGDVKIMRSGALTWQSLMLGDRIDEGDQIKTSADASAGLHYDLSFLNSVRIEPNTLAEFKSIEPTQLLLMDGRILNVLEGLPKDSIYEVSTPGSVASVRGTFFERAFNAAQMSEITSVLDGRVRIFPYWDEKEELNLQRSANLTEGKKISLPAKIWLHTELVPDTEDLTEGEKQNLSEQRDDARNSLIQFAGGEESYRQALQNWAELQKNAEVQKNIALALQAHSEHLKTDDLIAAAGSDEAPVVDAAIVGENDVQQQDDLFGAVEDYVGSSKEGEETSYTFEEDVKPGSN